MNLENMSKKDINNALNEIRILASLKSDYIIKYKEAFIEKDKNLNIIMEFATQGDL